MHVIYVSQAIKLCSRYLELDCDEIEKASVYSYRSRFYIELGDFESALEDANVSLQNSNKCVLVSTTLLQKII